MRVALVQLYEAFCKERFIEKTKRLSNTIYRANGKTFNSIHSEKETNRSKDKKDQKETAQAQRALDLAQVRGYDIRHLFKYDLVPSSYLFDACWFYNRSKEEHTV